MLIETAQDLMDALEAGRIAARDAAAEERDEWKRRTYMQREREYATARLVCASVLHESWKENTQEELRRKGR